MKKFVVSFILIWACALQAKVGMDQFAQLSFPLSQTYGKALEICKEKGYSHFLIKRVSYKDEKGQTLELQGISEAEGSVLISETITQDCGSPLGTLSVYCELLCFKKAPKEELAVNVQGVLDLVAIVEKQQVTSKIEGNTVREVTTMEELKKEIAKAKGPVYLECYLPTCPPCKFVAPIFEQSSKDFASSGTFLKVSLQAVPEVRDLYKIKTVPALIILEEGKEVDSKRSSGEIVEYFQNFK